MITRQEMLDYIMGCSFCFQTLGNTTICSKLASGYIIQQKKKRFMCSGHLWDYNNYEPLIANREAVVYFNENK